MVDKNQFRKINYQQSVTRQINDLINTLKFMNCIFVDMRLLLVFILLCLIFIAIKEC